MTATDFDTRSRHAGCASFPAMIQKDQITDLLPNSLTRTARHEIGGMFGGVGGKPIYCANCGVQGGHVPTTADYAFCLCESCAEKLPPIPGTAGIPLEKFIENLAAEQQEQFGRPATEAELMTVLEDPHNPISLLGRDRAKGL